MVFKKTEALIFAVFFITSLFAQKEPSAIDLVKILHAKDIELLQDVIKEMNAFKTEGDSMKTEDTADDLYIKLAATYENVFTDVEVKDAIVFYNSSLGQKLLENGAELNNRITQIINNWEMQQQGVFMEEPELLVFEDDRELNISAQDNKAFLKELETQKQREPLKINTLEDLKKIVAENPFMISDPNLLEALIGKEAYDDMHNPELLQKEFEAEKNKLGVKKQ